MAYQVIFTDEVLTTLNSIIFYLENRWNKKVAENFLHIFYKKVDLIASNPTIGRKSSKDSTIRKFLITKHNLLYYQISDDRIEILSIFFTVQNPDKNLFE